MGGKHALGAATDEVWSYDAVTSAWVQEANFPFGALWRASACAYNGKGFMLFGRDENNEFQHGFYSFDPITNQWESLPSFPSLGRSHAALFALNDGVYACFGIDSLGNSHNDLWKFNEIGNEWIALPGIPALGRRGGVCLTTQESMYYTTGIDETNNRLNQAWVYSPTLGIESPSLKEPTLLEVYNILGNPVDFANNQLLFERYSNGEVKKVFVLE
jgi:N-acetylneuraminic acid mutarotase